MFVVAACLFTCYKKTISIKFMRECKPMSVTCTVCDLQVLLVIDMNPALLVQLVNVLENYV